MSDTLCQIDVKNIDLKDERYKICLLEEDVTSLALSIQKIGLIYPPMVRLVNKQYVILSGFNRVKAFILNNVQKINVLKINPDLSDLQCLLRSITLIVCQRQLSQSELIRSVQLLNTHLTVQEIFQHSSWLFKQILNIHFIEQLLAIGKLPDPARVLIESNQLTLKAAQRLLFFDKNDIQVFLSIFEQINASSSKQLDIILYLKEIAARDKINIKTACERMKLDLILTDEKTDSVVKLQQLRTCLFENRFPSLSCLKAQVKQTISSLKLGPGIVFAPPENFESQQYTISFTAKNFEEFKTHVSTLEQQIHHDAIKKIFKP
ncbi:MAG: ParB N-terminal domain-containing protein [Pseudomonadota bacterium]